MTRSEHKRPKYKGRGARRPFVMLPHWIMDAPEFGALDGSALKLLMDFARCYNGKNNGDFSVANLPPGRWRSDQKRVRAIRILLLSRWLLKTRQGGLGLGPDLFAITWWPIDACDGKHSHAPETAASNLWREKTPLPNRELVAPESGTSEKKKPPEKAALVPDSGAMKAIFKAA